MRGLLLFLWVYFVVIACGQAQPNLHLGDVDDDGVITVRDMALVVEHVKGATLLDAEHAVLADVTKDGAVNQADVDEMIKEILETRTPEDLPLSTVRFTSPSNGEGDVAVTRETIVHFTVPLALNASLDTTQFYAEFAEKKVLSRVEISSDRKKASLFFMEPLPANTRVKLHLDGAALTDLLGRPFDADGDGAGGGTYEASFDTTTITPIAQTGITGRVLQAAPPGTLAENTTPVPIPGVTITVDGAEETLRVVTDADGYFTLSPCPTGIFFVHIDGRTSPASTYPGGLYYPSVGKQWEALAGKLDNLAGGTGIIYLPYISDDTLKPTSLTQETVVTFPPEVIAANPALAGTEFRIPANSLFADDGTRGGLAGIVPVPEERLPSPLPENLRLPFVFSFQTDGAGNFERPVSVTLPNLADPLTGIKPAPGEKCALVAFNHDTGQWEVVGPMTVTEDGLFMKTDVGVGLRQPGWGGGTPGGTAPGVGGEGQPPRPPCPDLDLDFDDYYEIAKAVGVCLLEIPKVYVRVAKLVKLVNTVQSVYGHAKSFYKDIASGQYDRAAARYAYEKLLEKVDDLEKELTEGTPIGQLEGIISCLEGLLIALEPFCQNADDKSECASETLKDACALRDFILDKIAEIREKIAYLKALLEALLLDELKALLNDILALIESDAPPSELLPPIDEIGGQLDPILDLPEDPIDLPGIGDIIDGGSRIIIIVTSPVDGEPVKGGYVLIRTPEIDIRTRTGSNGGYSVILPPNTLYSVAILDPKTLRIGTAYGFTGAMGSREEIPTPPMEVEINPVDLDGEGLSDRAEDVVGTLASNRDTDGDGIDDRAELANGSDPLSGLAVSTGVIGQAPLSGASGSSTSALDISSDRDLLAVASGAEGLQVLGVRQGLTPTRLAQVKTAPAAANLVTIKGNYIAAGLGDAGTMIVDVSMPDTPVMLRRIRLGSIVRSVAIMDDSVFIGLEDGRLAQCHIPTGRLIASVNLGSIPHDLALGRGAVYAAAPSGLKAIALNASGFGAVSTVSNPGNVPNTGRYRLFKGSNRLFLTHRSGVTFYNISPPAAPVLMNHMTTAAQGWSHFVPTGSNLAVSCLGANGPDDLSLYNLSEDGTNADFLTTFNTLGTANSVTVYNGLAYVADGAQGVQVVNFRAFDTLGNPPEVELIYEDGGSTAEEGQFLNVTATASDDVQVRNIEYYVDGEKVETDGNFPFDSRLLAPRIVGESSTFTLQARAYDTGGNSAWSQEVILTLTADTSAPHVTHFTPANASLLATCSGFSVKFSEPVSTDTLHNGTVRCSFAGPDGYTGTADDVSVPITLQSAEGDSSSYRETATFQTSQALAPGQYRVLLTLGIKDSGGNPMTEPFLSTFTVFGGIDEDNDGVPDDLEPALGLSPDNQDSDGNGIIDGMEDYDGDGLTNSFEVAWGFQPANADSNDNGINDGLEDSDQDTLSNLQEQDAGTNPNKVDTDGDNWPDQVEVEFGSNGNDARSKPLSLFVGDPITNIAIPATTGTVSTPPTTVTVLGTGISTATPPTTIRIDDSP